MWFDVLLSQGSDVIGWFGAEVGRDQGRWYVPG